MAVGVEFWMERIVKHLAEPSVSVLRSASRRY